MREHIHAVCQVDGPLDPVVHVTSGYMAGRLKMSPVIVNLVEAEADDRALAVSPRERLEGYVDNPGVEAISFALSLNGVFDKIDFEELAIRRSKEVRERLLVAAYCTNLWAPNAIDILDAAVPADDKYIRAFVVVLPPEAEGAGLGSAQQSLPLRLITRSAGLRVGSLDEFWRFAKLILEEPNTDEPQVHVPESLLVKLTLEGGHGLRITEWEGRVAHLLSCRVCGETARYYTLNAKFLIHNGAV